MEKPRIFVSAVSAEFRSTRRRVAEILTSKGYEPVLQENFGAQAGDLRAMHCAELDSCEGLIQITGQAYGWEPVDPVTGEPVPDAEFGRCSYTQFEFLYARKKDKKTWLFLAGPGVTRDTSPDALDWPAHPTSNPATWQNERRILQQAYQQRPEFHSHLRHSSKDDTDLELALERLDDELIKLRAEHEKWKTGVLKELTASRSGQRKGLWLGLGLAVVALAILISVFVFRPKPTVDDAAAIRNRLTERSESQLRADLAAAEKEKTSAKREEIRGAARAAHEERILRIHDIAERFAVLQGSDGATEVTNELSRILREESIQNALAYINSKTPELLAEAGKRTAAAAARTKAELRRNLSVLLTAADLKANQRDYDGARAGYKELLALDPDWPDALHGYARLLVSSFASYTLPPPVRLKDANDAHEIAVRLYAAVPTDPKNQYLLSATHSKLGYEMNIRRKPENAETVAQHYAAALALAQPLYDRHPGSEDYAENLAHLYYRWALFHIGKTPNLEPSQAAVFLEKALAIQQQRLKDHPTSQLARIRVEVYRSKLLREYLRIGEREKAFALCERILVQRQMDLQGSLEPVVSVEMLTRDCLETASTVAAGQSPGGLPEAQRWWTLTHALIKTSPPNENEYPDSLCSFADNLVELADSYAGGGQDSLALPLYQESVALLEKSWANRRRPTDDLSDSPDAITVSDILVSLSKALRQLALFHAAHRQPPDIGEAIRHARRNAELLSAFLRLQPDEERVADHLFRNWLSLGDYLLRRNEGNDEPEAVQCLRRYYEAAESRYKESPETNDSRDHLWRAALKLAAFVDQEESKRLQEQARDIMKPLQARDGWWTGPDEVDLAKLRAEIARRGRELIR